MGWATAKKESEPVQRELFPELSPDEMAVFEALKDSDGKHLNMLTVETNIPIGQLSSILFEMELRGIVRLLSGGMYKLV